MSPLNSGQNFVQASNNNGSFLGKIAASIMGANQMKMQIEARKDIVSHQTNERIRQDEAAARNKAIYGAVGRAANAHFAMQADKNYFDEATKRYDDNHEDVKSGKVKKDAQGNYPHLNEAWAKQVGYGIQKMPSGTQFAPVANRLELEQRQEYEKNNPTPPKPKREPKAPKAPKPKFEPRGDNKIIQPGPNDFQGYTPRKTGAGGYDEAYKAGEIDKPTYDSYIEDSKKPGKNYMDTSQSETHNLAVKERQAAESKRSDNLNDGIGEGNK